MTTEFSFKKSSLAVRQNKLQSVIDELLAQGNKPQAQITGWDPETRSHATLSNFANALSTRNAWLAILPDITLSFITWGSMPLIGITEDGMIAECRITAIWENQTCIAWPEPFFVRPQECKDIDTLDLLIELAKKNLAS